MCLTDDPAEEVHQIYFFFLEVVATRRFFRCFGIFSFRFSLFASLVTCLRSCLLVSHEFSRERGKEEKGKRNESGELRESQGW